VRALGAVSDALLAVASARSTEPVLQRLVEEARGLVAARYAALGIPDGRGGFAQFLTVGLTEDEIAAIGPLPRVHGMLGAMLADPQPFRTGDIKADPRFEYWPPAHPDMRSFLGVPVLASGEVIAAFYLTDKQGSEEFSDGDQQMIELFAAHAAVAIENARLWDRVREVTMLEERARLARDLHDAMTQTMFSLQLTAASASEAVGGDPDAARRHLATVQELARGVMAELRGLIVDLRPPELAADGLAATLAKHVDLLQRVHGVPITLDAAVDEPLAPHVEEELLRIAQEALHNALRHGRPARVRVRLTATGGEVGLEIRDDGSGFDPSDRTIRATRLGIVSMRHRARTIGGTLSITSAPGAGTSVEVVLGRG
jgi:signal transduction histidine kinase